MITEQRFHHPMNSGYSTKRSLVIIFLLALAVRIIWIATLDNTVDQWQEEGVKEAAWSIIQGKGYVIPRSVSAHQQGTGPYYSWREPGFTLFLVPVFFFFGENYLIAKLLLAILSSLSAVLLYLLGKETFGSKKIGITAALTSALLPELVFWNGYLTPESLAVFIYILPILFLTRSLKNPSFFNLAFSGILSGSAALTRTHMIIIFPVLLLVFIVTTDMSRKAIRNAGVIVLFFLLTFSPWIIRNYRIHKRFVIMPTVTGEAFFVANNPGTLKMINDPAGIFHSEDPAWFKDKSELEVTRWYRQEAFRFIRSQPKDYLRLVTDRFVRFWRFYPHLEVGIAGHIYGKLDFWVSLFTSGTIILLFIIGMCISLREWRKSLLLLALIVSFCVPTILGRAVIRYRLPIMPYIILIAAYGAHVLFFKPGTGNQGKFLKPFNRKSHFNVF